MSGAAQDCVATVELGGVEYAAREHQYEASVLQIADTFSIVIPAPDGRVLGADGSRTPIANVATMGAPAVLYLSDPNVQGGRKIPKLRGCVTGRRMASDAQSGTTLNVTGADLGWKLSTCGVVFSNIRGVKWVKFLQQQLGLTVNPVTGAVAADAYNLGFQGVRAGNLINRAIRLGRQAAQSDFQQDISPTLQEPRFQVEVGETIDSILVTYAKLDHFLINVSTDGWLQFFYPADSGVGKPYSATPLYQFFRYPAADPRSRLNNMINPVLDESADPLHTQVECWSTVIDTTDLDSTDPNAGRYHGVYVPPASPLPFRRLHTFTDTEQMSQARVDARAKWQYQRQVFDSWTYTFEAVGHSQNGAPFVEDTLCELHDLVFGIEGVFYVTEIAPSRRLARAGADKGAGTRCRITVKKAGLLAA